MSATVRYKGRLTKVAENKPLEELCKEICNQNGIIDLLKYQRNYQDVIRYDLYEKYVIVNNELYEIKNEELDSYMEFFEAEKKQDGAINFHVMYYSGACSFEEAIEEAFKNMKEG